jgi:transporter family-2 protein
MNSVLYLLAFCAGVGLSAQAAINAQLANAIAANTVVAALVSFCVGLTLLTIAAVARGGLVDSLALLPSQPLWLFAGGVLGAGFLFSTAFLAPRIGLTNMLVLIIAGQLLISVSIDHFGWLGALSRIASPARLIGVTVVLAGVLLTLFGDRLALFK